MENHPLEGMTTALAYDALNKLGVDSLYTHLDIKPQCGYTGKCVYGRAFITKGMVVEGLPEKGYNALDSIRLGIKDVDLPKADLGYLVVLSANDREVAHSGDITSLIYKKLGFKGFITDGLVRDKDYIDKLEFPTFCKGINPVDALGYWALVDFDCDSCDLNLRSQFMSILDTKPTTDKPDVEYCEIKKGDLLVADSDGVIKVPGILIPSFIKTFKEIRNKEDAVRVSIIKDVSKLNEIFDREGRW